MEKQLAEQAIASFFSFLEEHINHGFSHYKKEYTLENYDFNEFGKIKLQLNKKGYLIYPREEDSIDINKSAMEQINGTAYEEYLNPKEQTKVRVIMNSGEIKSYSLYHELNWLYNKELEKFNNSLTARLTYSFTSNAERKAYLSDIIKGLESNRRKINNLIWAVKDTDGNDNLLLYNILSKLIEEIQKDYLESPHLQSELSNIEQSDYLSNKEIQIGNTTVISDESGFSVTKEKKIHGSEKTKNLRDINLTLYYIKQRDIKNIEASVNATLIQFKNRNDKSISRKTFQRAIENKIEILENTDYIDDFSWTRKTRNKIKPLLSN